MTDTMSTIPSTPRRPARTYATGPVTRALRWFTVIAALGVTAWIREGERLMVWTGLGMQGVYAGISCSLLGSGGVALLVTGLVVMVGAVVLGIVRVVRAAR